jgi:predicted ATPase
MHKGALLTLTGAPADAARTIAVGLAAWRSTGSTLWVPCYLSHLAHASALAGDGEEAARRIGEAMAAVATSKATWCEAEVHRMAGEIALMRTGSDRHAAEAEACFGRALAIARAQRARAWELRAATSLARQWRDKGKSRKASDLLGPVYASFTEGLDTHDLRVARALLEGLGIGD